MLKMLPFNINVPINSFVHHAYPLGIISAQEDDYNNYLLYNYSQLVWYDHVGSYSGYELNFDVPFFKYSEAFNREFIDNNLLKKLGIFNLLDYIITALNNDRYIYLCIDYYYLPGTDSYLLKHNQHDLLIYGYNRKEFVCAGYGDTKKYTKLILPFDKFELCNPTYIDLLSYNKIKNDYSLDLIKSTFYKYLYTKNELESSKYDDDRLYGVTACIKTVEYIKQSMNNNERINIIPLCLLREFFLLMNNRFSLFIDFNSNTQRTLNDKMDTLINLAIKYNLTSNNKDLDFIIQQLNFCIDYYTKTIEEKIL